MKSYNELIKPIKFIELDDLCELIGVKHSCSAFLSTSHYANDNYVPIDCSDHYLEELYNMKAHDLRASYGVKWRERYENEIKLIETLRGIYGIRDTIFTYVS